MGTSFPPSPFGPPEGNLPFAGIATFAGCPLWRREDQAHAVVLGVPYDEGVTYRPGARFGPRAVRDASMFYSYEGREDRFFDADRRRWILSGKAVADAGDVAIEPLVGERNRQAVTRAVRAILETGAVPAVLGGDHSIVHPVLEAFAEKRVHYVHLDSHIDCDRAFESDHTHGSPVANILRRGLARSITLMGVRGLTNSGRDMAWIEEQGVRVVTARELRKALEENPSLLFPQGNCYLSVDIDFFDPAVAPGTGTPEPGGFFFPEFSDLVQCLRGRLAGFDVVEVSPFLDGPGAVTAHLAARCLLEMMSAALDPP